MRSTILIAISALSMGAVPALAQDAMMKSGQAKMSTADTKKMKSCQAMSRDKMMKNAGCARMMKMHPDTMGSDAMMKSDGMKKGS